MHQLLLLVTKISTANGAQGDVKKSSTRENISSWNYDKSVPQNGMYSSSNAYSSSRSNAYSSSSNAYRSSSSKSTYYFSRSKSTYCPAFHATTL
uniref:Uncharacterized protein n=1 Tax=Leersia perrieri TaxID=77586 RepID=A0A0D9XV07_9ORYZ